MRERRRAPLCVYIARAHRCVEKRQKPPRYIHTVSGMYDVTRMYRRRSNFLPPIRYGFAM